MKRIFLRLLVLSTAFLFSCRKDCNKCIEVTGTLSDLTGKLDGCGFVIVLPDGTRLEPVMAPEGFAFIDGKEVSFCYEVKPAPSICMAGQTVIIKRIRYIP